MESTLLQGTSKRSDQIVSAPIAGNSRRSGESSNVRTRCWTFALGPAWDLADVEALTEWPKCRRAADGAGGGGQAEVDATGRACRTRRALCRGARTDMLAGR